MSAPAAVRPRLLSPARLEQLAARHRSNTAEAWRQAQLYAPGTAERAHWAGLALQHQTFTARLDRAITGQEVHPRDRT